ncbi:MAG: alkaline shock response membrane anchor protein AmaP [Pseudonocardiaceae bacterium]
MSTPAPSTTSATAARHATARAAGAQRTLVGLIGFLVLVAGVAVVLAGSGLLGANRAARPVLDPLAVDLLRANQTLARVVSIAAGVVLLVLGLLWVTRAVKPESHPNLLLDASPDHRLEVSASAIADALRADAETVAGVSRARARMVGTIAVPAVRLELWLEDGADVRNVYHDLDSRVLTHARDSLGVHSLPTAIRIELDTVAAARVS